MAGKARHINYLVTDKQKLRRQRYSLFASLVLSK